MKKRITDIWEFFKDPENVFALGTILGTISAFLYSAGYFIRTFKR